MDNDKIRSITLRVAIFFGLTTFTLCIAIFYIEAILDDTRDVILQKDSTISILEIDVQDQQMTLEEYELKISDLNAQLESYPQETTVVEVSE